MNRNPEHDTREHLLAVGEHLCLSRGFTGMGLSELLRTAEVPKGSFYHYFRSKEAFGVVMLEQYHQRFNQQLRAQLAASPGEHGKRLLHWYQSALQEFCASGRLNNCLAVKLSAEVCDLSEDMRTALDNGARCVIALLAESLQSARDSGELCFAESPQALAQVLYALWLGASLQAKLSRSSAALEFALDHITHILVTPVC